MTYSTVFFCCSSGENIILPDHLTLDAKILPSVFKSWGVYGWLLALSRTFGAELRTAVPFPPSLRRVSSPLNSVERKEEVMNIVYLQRTEDEAGMEALPGHCE